ncbi:MAG: hypothetical protein K2X57_26345 [Xanthobacteraceae bacterium]|nr:hypothetical protein [Xanthobacteraceae bacterium]
MKRPRKNKPLFSDDEIAEMVSRSIHYDPPSIEKIVREALAEEVNNRRGNEKRAAQKKRKEANSNYKRLLFFVTHALMIEFYKASRIGPPLRKEKGITRSSATAIARLLPSRMSTALATIEKCFEDPSSVERPGAALRARQIVCWALGRNADAFSINGDRVSFLNEAALLKNVQRALDSAVTVTVLRDAVREADIASKRK